MDHTDIVARHQADLAASGVDIHTVDAAFEVVKRTVWELRTEDAGLLLKPSGENIVTWRGKSYSASRVCYPSGAIVKVLTDVPTTNGPTWANNGTVDPALYGGALNPAEVAPPPVVDPPEPPAIIQVLMSFAAQLMALQAAVAALKAQSDANTEKIQTQIDQVVKAAEKSAKEYLPFLPKP